MAIIFTLKFAMYVPGKTKTLCEKVSFITAFQTKKQQCHRSHHDRLSGWELRPTTLASCLKHVPSVPALLRTVNSVFFPPADIICTSQANRRHIIKAHPSVCGIDRIVTGR
jgi:hypothetical protein